MREIVLDLGSGKFNPDLMKKDDNVSVIHIDRCFKGLGVSSTMDQVMNDIMNSGDSLKDNYFCGYDIFEFLDNFPYKGINKIISNRFFEHLEYCGGEVGRMLEACNNITLPIATLEIVVPNALTLCKMLCSCEELDNYSDNDVMILNTEFCNGKFDPHATIWTPNLARKYIDQEATWKITKIIEKYPFAGRDIYMKIFCTKPQTAQHNHELDSIETK